MGVNGWRGVGLAMLYCGAVFARAADGTAGADPEQAQRAARWSELEHAIFGSRAILDGSGWVGLDAPQRALDAALVPVNLTLAGDRPIKGLYLIIDNNPAPLAGHFIFGPQADPHSLELRVRVNAYTDMHAVAESADGELYAVARFVKAAGGCSAPMGTDAERSMQDIGHIKLRIAQPFVFGQPMQALLMVRHPNFNGMQMDQVTHLYTPARFIRSIDVSFEGARVWHLDSDISLSSDPVINFGFIAPREGRLKVVVRDTEDETFEQTLDVAEPSG